MSRFIAIFLGTLVVLFTLQLLHPVQAAVIEPFTTGLARLAASVITPFDDTVTSTGRVLRDSVSGFAVSIEAGCNGVEASLVLIAGLVAFPATLPRKTAGIVLGLVALQALNLLRIISLFYLGQWNLTLFEWTHLYLWPVLIMLDVLVLFALYQRWLMNLERAGPAH